jgi:putative flavoprotein involved in K+ transport
MSGSAEWHEVVIVGGGQAGLALGHELARLAVPCIILEAAPRVGHSWRVRWDSLTLFTPHPFNSLPGLPFPPGTGLYPTKDEVADYLERYAATFDLPVRLGCRVITVRPAPEGPGYLVETTAGRCRARRVVIAIGPFQRPRLPPWSADLPPAVHQLHSSEYRNPGQLPPGDVLVVGAGNSGVQIATELACNSAGRTVYVAVGDQLPVLPRRLADRLLFWRIFRLASVHATVRTRLGRWLSRRDALFGVGPARLAREHGLVLVGRATGVEGDRIVAGDNRIGVRTCLWATGFRSDYRWVDVPVFDELGRPRQRRGMTAAPGLYFLGLYWQEWVGSAMLGGVGRDATYLARHIAASVAGQRPETL